MDPKLTDQKPAALAQKLDAAIRNVPDFPKPGILFKDITPILSDPALCRQIVETMYAHFADKGLEVIVGIESRGFLFGMLLAVKLNIPFVPIRKKVDSRPKRFPDPMRWSTERLRSRSMRTPFPKVPGC